MPAYEYRAVDSQGKLQKGLLEGDSSRQVRFQLKARGLTVLQVRQVPINQKMSSENKSEKNDTHRPSYRAVFLSIFSTLKNYYAVRKTRLKHAELTLLTRQLSTLISAGLPIEEALSGLLEQTEKTSIKRILAAIRAKITDGYALSASLQQFPRTFSKLYVASVTAGEQTGRLAEVLVKLADHLESQYALYQKVTQALVYPLMMLLISLCIVIFLLMYVVPKIIEVFQDSHQALPMITQFLLSLSQFFQQWGIFLLCFILLSYSMFYYMLKKNNVRFKYEKFLITLPFLGYFIKTSNTAKFSRTLGILVETGVPVLESMYIALEVVERLPIQDALKISAQRIKEGTAIHTAIKQTGYFNAMSIYLIANGEATGKLENMLEKMAHYQEQELTRIINIGLSLFEPILILVMGVFTLFIVLAILLPIFSYNQLIG